MNYPKLKRITSYVIGALVILTGVAFIFACAHLYYTGTDPIYSRERVGRYLLYLLPISVPTLLATVFGGVLSLISPEKEKGIKVDLSKVALKRLYLKLDESAISDEAALIIKNEKKKRKIYSITALCLTLIYTVMALIISLDTSRYTKESVNSDIAGTVLIILPLAVAIIGIVTLLGYLRDESFKRELKAVRSELAGGATLSSPTENDTPKNQERALAATYCLRVGITALAAVLIVIGIYNGGMADVLGKAVKICTECIGLG